MNIKKLFSSFAAAILVFAACEETNPDLGDPSVTLSKTQLEFAKEGGSQEITLNSTRDWSVLNRPEWVSITPEKGAASAKDQTIVISVMDNADAPRSCVITFIGTTARADLAIVQDGDGVAPGGEISCAEFLERKDTENEYILTGVIGDISRGSSYYGFSLKDETGSVSCPFPTNFSDYSADLHTGDEVSIKGTYSFYESKNQDQLANGEILSHKSAMMAIETVTVAQFIEKADVFSIYRMTGIVSGTINSNYCSFDLKDETGSIYVYSVNNAEEYGSKIKAGDKVTLCGAYTYYASKSQHEVVDCTIEKLEQSQGGGDDPGTDPKTIFSVDFTAGQGDFSIDTRKAPEGLAVWTQSSSYGMVASGYVKADSKDYDTESWLVSPVIDLSSEKAAFLSFEHACNFFTDIETAKKEVGVKVKVEGGEWESLSGFAYPETLSWSFVNSGSVDLASYLGKKIQIAFVYTSTAAKAGTWEIKNVSVKSEPGGTDTPDVPEGAITWLMGTNNGQSWSSVTDASYGDGYEYTKDGITLGYYKNKSSSNPVDAKTDHIRVYKFYALKIKSTKPLKSIIFYTTESAYAFDLTDAEGKMTAAADAASKTISWTGSASELLFFANNGQVRINKIVFVCE